VQGPRRAGGLGTADSEHGRCGPTGERCSTTCSHGIAGEDQSDSALRARRGVIVMLGVERFRARTGHVPDISDQ